MKIQFKKLVPEAQKPKFGKPGDAGADLVATSLDFSRKNQVVYGTGLAVEIPEGMVGLVFPRSSIRNYHLSMSNSVGVIDSGYRGEIMLKYTRGQHLLHSNHINSNANFKEYEIGDRVGQLIILPYPQVHFQEVESLSETERGEGGYGSTGI